MHWHVQCTRYRVPPAICMWCNSFSLPPTWKSGREVHAFMHNRTNAIAGCLWNNNRNLTNVKLCRSNAKRVRACMHGHWIGIMCSLLWFLHASHSILAISGCSLVVCLIYGAVVDVRWRICRLPWQFTLCDMQTYNLHFTLMPSTFDATKSKAVNEDYKMMRRRRRRAKHKSPKSNEKETNLWACFSQRQSYL